jgi:multimeric flavodoxin WrbA
MGEFVVPKNILVLTGSPRKKGNSDRLADAFIKGAQDAGHKAVKYQTAFKKIAGCRACKTCWSKGSACSLKDDFSEVEPLLENADVIVFCTPLYWFAMSSHIKAVIDRMNSYLSDNCPKPLSIKESVLLICGADEGPGIFKGVVETYKSIAEYMKWTDLGVIAVNGASDKGDIDRTEGLKHAEELGKSIL